MPVFISCKPLLDEPPEMLKCQFMLHHATLQFPPQADAIRLERIWDDKDLLEVTVNSRDPFKISWSRNLGWRPGHRNDCYRLRRCLYHHQQNMDNIEADNL